jgi:hypothetical protein
MRWVILTIPGPVLGQIVSLSSLNVRHNATLPTLRSRFEQARNQLARNHYTALEVAKLDELCIAGCLVHFFVLLERAPCRLGQIGRAHV